MLCALAYSLLTENADEKRVKEIDRALGAPVFDWEREARQRVLAELFADDEGGG